MSKKTSDAPIEEKERQAAQIFVAFEGRISVPQAMKHAGFDAPMRKNPSTAKRISRKAKKLIVVDKSTVSSGEVASTPSTSTTVLASSIQAPNANTGSSVSSLSAPPSQSSRSTNQSATLVEQQQVQRNLLCAPPTKKRRRSSKEKHKDDAEKRRAEKLESKAIKTATTRIANMATMPDGNPMKVSQMKVVEDVNKMFKTNISHKTVSRMVREGRIGTSPKKRGPVGDFPKAIWDSMKFAFVTFAKLEQAHSKKQSTMNELAQRVNRMVNHAGCKKTGNDLVKKLKAATADQFNVDERNPQELRRLVWTTCTNLNCWHGTWELTLVCLGFGRQKQKEDDDKHEGNIVFFSGQRRRIINLDETDGSVDNTNGKRGGRKPMVFCAPDVGGGGTQANKSACSPTVICGSTSAGEALPPHFQLKASAAKAEERERFNVEFMEHCKDVLGRFGTDGIKSWPCTFGMNEKAGMNAVELQKHLCKGMLPLHPDMENVPGKRVIVKVDSGPGRLNVTMLAEMKLKGLCVIPGVPNTTSKTQETDQSCGPFKTCCRANLSTLSTARFEAKKSLAITDLPSLAFGGKDPVTNADLKDAFQLSFNNQQCLSAWRKCGAVPATRSPLHDKDDLIRHEVIYNADGSASNLDPESMKLIHMEEPNHWHCDCLNGHGMDGDQLKGTAPKQSAKKFQVTAPQLSLIHI